jgi:hypothetical protein
VPFISV